MNLVGRQSGLNCAPPTIHRLKSRSSGLQDAFGGKVFEGVMKLKRGH